MPFAEWCTAGMPRPAQSSGTTQRLTPGWARSACRRPDEPLHDRDVRGPARPVQQGLGRDGRAVARARERLVRSRPDGLSLRGPPAGPRGSRDRRAGPGETAGEGRCRAVRRAGAGATARARQLLRIGFGSCFLRPVLRLRRVGGRWHHRPGRRCDLDSPRLPGTRAGAPAAARVWTPVRLRARGRSSPPVWTRRGHRRVRVPVRRPSARLRARGAVSRPRRPRWAGPGPASAAATRRGGRAGP